MQTHQFVIPVSQTDAWFPSDPEGQNVQASPAAKERAREIMGLDIWDDSIKLGWHLPDVFSVRYGSSYIATATHGNQRVRFLMDEGTFREEDAQ